MSKRRITRTLHDVFGIKEIEITLSAEEASPTLSVEPEQDDLDHLAQKARKMYALRRKRDNAFKHLPFLFGEPAWDMLLDLAIQEGRGRPVAVSDLCIAAAVPSTTALRWIAMLEREGLIARTIDPTDRRRYFMSLTPHGVMYLRLSLE